MNHNGRNTKNHSLGLVPTRGPNCARAAAPERPNGAWAARELSPKRCEKKGTKNNTHNKEKPEQEE